MLNLMFRKMKKLREILLLSLFISPLLFFTLQPYFSFERFVAEGICLTETGEHFDEMDRYTLEASDLQLALHGKVVLSFSEKTNDSKFNSQISSWEKIYFSLKNHGYDVSNLVFFSQFNYHFSNSRAPPSHT